MDKIELKNGFLSDLLCRILSKIIYKNLGVKVVLNINDINVESKDGNVEFKLDVNGKMEEKDFNDVLNMITN